MITDLLRNSQHCGLTRNTDFEAIATTRDAIAYAEVTRSPLCVLTMNVQGAHYNSSHEYLFEVPYNYGFSERFRKRIWKIYKNSTSSVQINGYRSTPFRSKGPSVRGVL